MTDCETCDRTFINIHSARQHMNAVGHWACNVCTQEFWSESDATDHMNDWGHWRPQYECEACSASFAQEIDARRHMDAHNHWRKHWCGDCQRGFQNENNLRMHMHSRIHQGSTITCPFCSRNFATATGVTQHLETGSCPKARNLNHETILSQIRQRDRGHLITKKLLTGSDQPTNVTYTVSNASWNGHYYECYLCHREFNTPAALTQHLNSPAHRQNVYHCPAGRTCVKEFKTLASLFNHLESEACGAVRFDVVQRNVSGFLEGGQRMISFR